MIFWFIVGFIMWTLCILFMLAIFKGGSTTHGYEQKLLYRNMVNPQNIEDSINKEVKKTTRKQEGINISLYLPISEIV